MDVCRRLLTVAYRFGIPVSRWPERRTVYRFILPFVPSLSILYLSLCCTIGIKTWVTHVVLYILFLPGNTVVLSKRRRLLPLLHGLFCSKFVKNTSIAWIHKSQYIRDIGSPIEKLAVAETSVVSTSRQEASLGFNTTQRHLIDWAGMNESELRQYDKWKRHKFL